MIIPREIREKIEQRNQLNEEIADWFQENVDADGCDKKTLMWSMNRKEKNRSKRGNIVNKQFWARTGT